MLRLQGKEFRSKNLNIQMCILFFPKNVLNGISKGAGRCQMRKKGVTATQHIRLCVYELRKLVCKPAGKFGAHLVLLENW